MVRKLDKKNDCKCGGRYLDSNKWKHVKTKRHQEWSKWTKDEGKKSTNTVTRDNHVICKHCHGFIHNKQEL